MFNWFINIFASKDQSIKKTAEEAAKEPTKKESYRKLDETDSEAAYFSTIETELQNAAKNYNPSDPMFSDEQLEEFGLKHMLTAEQNTKGFWENVIISYFTKNDSDLGLEFSLDKLRTLKNKGINALLNSKNHQEDATTGLFLLVRRFLSTFNPSKLKDTKAAIAHAIESVSTPEAIKQNSKRPKTRKFDSNYIKLLQQSLEEDRSTETPNAAPAQDVKHTVNKLDKSVRAEILNLLFEGISKSFYSYCGTAGSNLLGNIIDKLYRSKNDTRVLSMDSAKTDDADGDDDKKRLLSEEYIRVNDGDAIAEDPQEHLEEIKDSSQSVGLVGAPKHTPKQIQERVQLATHLAKQIMSGMPGMNVSSLAPLFKLKYSREAKRMVGDKNSPKEDVLSQDPQAAKLLLIPRDSEIKQLIADDYKKMTFPDKFAALFGTSEAKTLGELTAQRDGVLLAVKFLSGLLNNKSGVPTDTRKMNLDQYRDQVKRFIDTLTTPEEKASAKSFLSIDFVDKMSAVLAKKREKSYGGQQKDLREFTDEIIDDLTKQIQEVRALSKSDVAERVEVWLRQRKEYSEAVAKRMYRNNMDRLNSVFSYLDAEYDFLQNNARKEVNAVNKEDNASGVNKKDSRAAARYDIASFVTKQRDFLIDRLSALESVDVDGKDVKVDFSPIIEKLKNADAITTTTGEKIAEYKTAAQLAAVTQQAKFSARITGIQKAIRSAIVEAQDILDAAGVNGSNVLSKLDKEFVKGNGYNVTTYVTPDVESVSRMYRSVVPEVARRIENDNISGREMQEFQGKESERNINKLQRDLENDKKLLKVKEEELNKKNTDGSYVIQDEKIVEEKEQEIRVLKERIKNRENAITELKEASKKWSAENPFPDLNKFEDVTLHSKITPDKVLHLYGTKEAVVLDNGKYYKVFRTPNSDELVLSHKPVKEPALTDPALVSYNGKNFVRFFVEDRNTGNLYPLKGDKLPNDVLSGIESRPFEGGVDVRMVGDLDSYSVDDLNEKMTAQRIRVQHERGDEELAESKKFDAKYKKHSKEYNQYKSDVASKNVKALKEEIDNEDYFLKRDLDLSYAQLRKVIDSVLDFVDDNDKSTRALADKSPQLRDLYDKLKKIDDFYNTPKIDKEKFINEKGEPLQISIKHSKPEELKDALMVLNAKLSTVFDEYKKYLPEGTKVPAGELPKKEVFQTLRDAVMGDTNLDIFEPSEDEQNLPEKLNYKVFIPEEEPAQEPEKKNEEPKPEENNTSAGFSFRGLQKSAAPFFHISRVALDMTDNQLQKEVENPSLVQTPDEMVADKHNKNNETLLSGQKSQEQDIKDSKSFKTKKVAQALKIAYDSDPSHELFNTLVQVVRDSNPTTGPATAEALSYLPETKWSMEAAYRMYNDSNVAEAHDRHYFQECLRRDGWPAMLKNDKFVQLLNKSNQGQA